MSNKYYFILLMVLAILTGCSKEKNIEFVGLYDQVIGYEEDDEMYEPIPEDVLLMLDVSEINEFNNQYFVSREIQFDTPRDGMAELFIQIQSNGEAVNSYGISSITKSNKELIVNLKKTGSLEVDRVDGFNGVFKWVIVAEIDKQYLTDNMEITINKD